MPWSSLFQPVERLSAEQGLEDWYGRLLASLGGTPAPFELALVGGLRAATPGLAFLAGYQAEQEASLLEKKKGAQFDDNKLSSIGFLKMSAA